MGKNALLRRERPRFWWCMNTLRCITIRQVGCSLAVAVLVCVVSLGEQAAQASCGDWLADHAAETDSTLRDGGPTPDVIAQIVGSEAAKHPLPARRPERPRCHGPACSRLPSLPLTPIEQAEVFSAPDRMSACISHANLSTDVLISWVLENDTLLLSDEPTSRIERPPMHG